MRTCNLCGHEMDGLGLERKIVELTAAHGFYVSSFHAHQPCYIAAVTAARDASGLTARLDAEFRAEMDLLSAEES